MNKVEIELLVGNHPVIARLLQDNDVNLSEYKLYDPAHVDEDHMSHENTWGAIAFVNKFPDKDWESGLTIEAVPPGGCLLQEARKTIPESMIVVNSCYRWIAFLSANQARVLIDKSVERILVRLGLSDMQ